MFKGFAAALSKDFTEFANVVTKETGHLVHTMTGEAEEETGVEQSGLVAGDEGTSEGTLFKIPDSELQKLQKDPRTYDTALVEEDAQSTADWQRHFGTCMSPSNIAALLENNATVSQHFRALVEGGDVAEDEFWMRYFYRLFRLRKDHSRKALLSKAAEQEESEEELGWDDPASGEPSQEPRGAAGDDTPLTATTAADQEQLKSLGSCVTLLTEQVQKLEQDKATMEREMEGMRATNAALAARVAEVEAENAQLKRDHAAVLASPSPAKPTPPPQEEATPPRAPAAGVTPSALAAIGVASPPGPPVEEEGSEDSWSNLE